MKYNLIFFTEFIYWRYKKDVKLTKLSSRAIVVDMYTEAWRIARNYKKRAQSNGILL